MIFFFVGVMYSGEYDACDVSLSVYPHRASLKLCLTTVGIETTTFGILAQCSANRVVRVCDISEQNLVPSISM